MTKKNYYRNEGALSSTEQLIVGIIVLLILIWFFVIKPFIEYIRQHLVFFSIFGIIILVGLVLGIVFYIQRKIKKEKEKKVFEKEQIEKGLIKFIDRFGNERWGKPDEVKNWTKENKEAEEKEKMINQIVSEINNFNPSRKYKNEFPYQIELIGYLKHKFPNADIEKRKGSSRPDIIVGDVAIEIKGPTRTRDLQTIADKCMRYYQHFGELIIVLFDVNVYEPRYNEWKKGINNTFSKVKIIRK